MTVPPAYRLRLVVVAASIVVVVAAFMVFHMMASPPADLDLSRAKTSEMGLYEVAIEPEAATLTLGALHSWLLTLKTPAGQPVTGATIAIDGGMPDHGHGLPTSPVVSADLGNGKYRVEGMKFTMTGWWQLRFAINAPAASDDVVFNVKM